MTKTRHRRKSKRKRKNSAFADSSMVLKSDARQDPTVEPATPVPAKSIQSVLETKLKQKAKRKEAIDQLHETSAYQTETRRPLVCLIFVLPMILIYEFGTILLGGQSYRSGVDQWFEYLLSQIGFGQLVLLPVVAAGILLNWHHRAEDHWKIRGSVLLGMAVEAIGLGLILFWAAKSVELFSLTALESILQNSQPVLMAGEQWVANAMSLVGSGIYEELFFRLILLSAAIWFSKFVLAKIFPAEKVSQVDSKIKKRNQLQRKKNQQQRLENNRRKFGAVIAIVAVSFLFASLHYDFINPAGASFHLPSFFFRFTASIVFSILFLFRGFGIAAGTHVAFDLFTQL